MGKAKFISDVFNNREIALIVYLMLFIVFLFVNREMRKSTINLLKIVFTTRIFIGILLIVLTYTVCCVLLLSRIDLWTTPMWSVVIFWFFGEALLVMFKANDLDKEEHPFKKLFIDMFKVTLLVAFISNFYVFQLWQEFILIPVLIIFSMMQVVSEIKEEHKAIKPFLEKVNVVFGLFILGFFFYRLINSFSEFASIYSIKIFLLPIILSVGLTPLIYALLLFFKYDELFIRFRKKYNKEFDKPRRARWLARKAFWLNYLSLRVFLKTSRVRTFGNYESVKKAVDSFKNTKN